MEYFLLFSYLAVARIQEHGCSVCIYLVSTIIVELSYSNHLSLDSLISYIENHIVCKE